MSVGIDIVKEGIRFAAAEYSNSIWCVADIANCPFTNQNFNFLLNVLSPANYSEFKRLITEDGFVVKVIPERDYLKELREIFFEGSDKRVYSNAQTLKHFYEEFELTNVENIRYEVNLNKQMIEPLLGMTPLSWGASRERLEKVHEVNLKQITMDFKILIGKK